MATQVDEDIYSLRSVAEQQFSFAEKMREDVTAVQRLTRVGGLIETNRTHHQPGIASGKGY
jgi:hypothetical protein